MSTTALKTDVAAREALERAERAAVERDGTLALEACDMLAGLRHAGYRLTPLANPEAVTARPVRLRARYEGICASCGAEIAVDDPVWWTRGVQGIDCARCGNEAARG
jgi:hypothetical protein